jgi:hypothetical protein
VTVDRESRTSLLSWIDGEPVNEVSDADVQRFADFQLQLHDVIDAAARVEIGEASEACLSGRRIVSHIRSRFDRLNAVKHQVHRFADFFDAGLEPALTRFEATARSRYAWLGIDFDSDLPADQRTLIPSDFGAHNALRNANGELSFVDFEYFGWDDPLTSVGNFIFHPGMTLTSLQRRIYQTAIVNRFGAKSEARREALMPLFGLRFAAIILGELQPERWQHRVASGIFDIDDWDAACRRQIEKAQLLLDQLGLATR